jgi:hypothetical protein
MIHTAMTVGTARKRLSLSRALAFVGLDVASAFPPNALFLNEIDVHSALVFR